MEMDLVALLQQTEVPPLPPRRPNENSGQNTRSTGGNTVGGDLNGMHSTAADASTSGMVAAAQTAGSVGSSGPSDGQLSKRPKPSKPLPPGTTLTDRSCERCRLRKVKCNRVFPRCQHCIQRDEDCDLRDWKPKAKKVAVSDPARVAFLEKRLAELEASIANATAASHQTHRPVRPSYDPARAVISDVDARALVPNFADVDSPASSSTTNDLSNIGTGSIDWRLATPQMASALSKHLCEAFFESCCFMLPAYTYYWPRIADFRLDESDLSKAAKVAVASFRAVGARTSNHSALLGITIDPSDGVTHPNAPLLSAGTRRQSACSNFYSQAHTLAFESGLAEEVAVENLAVLLTLIQMSIFVELQPKKSRTLLRSSLDLYRDLIDAASSDLERKQLKQTFGFAIYSADSVIAATARRSFAVSDHDLCNYFDQIGLVIPRMPDDRLWSVIEKVLETARASGELKHLGTVRHLLHCWVCAAQRVYAKLASPPSLPTPELIASIKRLWAFIDQTRLTIQQTLNYLSVHLDSRAFDHAHDHELDGHHKHDNDWAPQFIRLDRDMLDLINLVHGTLTGLQAGQEVEEMRRESLSRVRRGLKSLALYAKLYTDGADRHVIFHLIFQLDLLPNWTTLALQRVGERGGPTGPEEELSEMEIGWLVEGLQLACFYFPDAEKRLAELSPRFTPVVETSAVTPDFTSMLPLDPTLDSLFTFPPLSVDDMPFSMDAFLNEDVLLGDHDLPAAIMDSSSLDPLLPPMNGSFQSNTLYPLQPQAEFQPHSQSHSHSHPSTQASPLFLNFRS